MKPGDTVITPDGEGVIVKKEFFKHAKRWGIWRKEGRDECRD